MEAFGRTICSPCPYSSRSSWVEGKHLSLSLCPGRLFEWKGAYVLFIRAQETAGRGGWPPHTWAAGLGTLPKQVTLSGSSITDFRKLSAVSSAWCQDEKKCWNEEPFGPSRGQWPGLLPLELLSCGNTVFLSRTWLAPGHPALGGQRGASPWSRAAFSHRDQKQSQETLSILRRKTGSLGPKGLDC